MSKAEKIRGPSGEMVEATPIDVVGIVPNTTIVHLGDGATLEVSVAIMRVHKIEGQRDPSGNPVYSVQNQSLVRVQSTGNE